MKRTPFKLTPCLTIRSLASSVLAVSALTACGDRSSSTSDELPPPVGAVVTEGLPGFDGASTPNFAAGRDGAVHVSFVERVDSATNALRFASWNPQSGAWSEARDIVRSRDLFVNWADFSSMAVLDNGDLAAHWLEREGEGTYSYGVRIARSRDGGATWDSARTPHADGLLAEHGFVSMWAAGGDAVGAVWLDGRKTAMPDSAREMTIRTAVFGAATAEIPEVLLDSRACDCCQTSSAATASGRVIVYRDRTADEIRDIAIVRESNGQWSEPQVVHDDNWHFEACPVNGPSVAASGDTVVVAWFTGAQDTARVRLARSVDGGVTFAAPVRVDDGDPIGRVSVVLDAQGRPVVLWMERVGADSSAVRVRRVSHDGRLSSATTVATVSGSRRSGFPRLARSGDQLLFAFTVPGERSQVRLATAPLEP